MSTFWNFAFGAVLIIIWIVAGGFVTQANTYLHHYRNDDKYLNSAYWYTFWAAFVTWFLIGVFILLVILSIIGVVALFGTGVGEAGVAAEAAEVESAESLGKGKQSGKILGKSISWFTIAFLVFALSLVAVTGILAAIAASDMVKSPNYDNTNRKLKSAYESCIISACVCLGAAGLIIIGIIVYVAIGLQKKKKIEQQAELIAKSKSINAVPPPPRYAYPPQQYNAPAYNPNNPNNQYNAGNFNPYSIKSYTDAYDAISKYL